MNERVIRVWDLPLRLFHWLLLAAVTGALVSIKIGGSAALVWHGRFGQAVLGLIVFRLMWGLIGSRTARFASFVRGPRAIRDYLAGRWAGSGHNPVGALSVLALLGLFGFQAATGLFTYDAISFRGPMAAAVSSDTVSLLSDWHTQTEWWLYGLIALHVAAVLWYACIRKERILRPMLNGRKTVAAGDERYRDNEGGGALRVLIAVAIALAVVWATSGVFNPPPPPPPPDLGW